MGKIAETGSLWEEETLGLKKSSEIADSFPVCVFCHLQTLRFNCLISEQEKKQLGATLDWEDKDGFCNEVAF